MDRTDPGKSKIAWKWGKGAATFLAEFGDPSTSNHFLLCVYDGSETPVLRLLIPAGGTCGEKPCWKRNAKGFSFKNKGGLPGKVKLTAGETAGKAKISVRGSGASLSALSLPFTTPVKALLLNDSTLATWCATYVPPAISDPVSSTRWRDMNE